MKILVAPLDWGLGHAARCIPVIQKLMDEGNEVLLAGDGNVKRLLQKEFPQLKSIDLEGYHIRYSSRFSAWFKILIQVPKIAWAIVAEHRRLKRIIEEHHVDMVVSDNRFGLWNKKIKSVYITHQVMIKCPRGFKIAEPLISKIHCWIIHHYDECWIPDDEGINNLSGDLSHKYPKPENAKYIGALSRFQTHDQQGLNATPDGDGGLLIIISGPEPSRSEFEKIIFHQLRSFPVKATVILGKPGDEYSKSSIEGVQVFSHLEASQLREVILRSRLVLCRAGYSGIMDLMALKKDAVLVPTPGQTEQEYLAKYLQQKKLFRCVRQSELDLRRLDRDAEGFGARNFLVHS